MPADLETIMRAAAPEPEPPDPRGLWERGRRRRRAQGALAGAAGVVVLAILAAGLGLGDGHDGVSVQTDIPSTTAVPPSTIDTSGAGWTTYADPEAGFTVDLPPGWSVTTDGLTGLTDPVERLTAASYPLQRHSEDEPGLPACQVPLPAAIGDGGPMGAFATIMEATHPIDTSTLDHRIGSGSLEFVPTRLDTDLCGPDVLPPGSDVRWIWFGDGQRFFYLAVAIGPDTPAATRTMLWQMLDSFRPT